jgi:hypothetical protein
VGIAKFLLLCFMGVLGAIAVATSAGAYFASHGSGAGSAQTATFNPPTSVIASFPVPTVRTVDVTWTAADEPDGIKIDGYYVQRYLGATPSPACGTSPTTLISTVSCADTDVASGTYTYTVTAVFRTWTATSAPSGPVTVPAAVLSSFDLAPSTSTPQAGTAFTVGITAMDQYGEVDASYTGLECLTFSGPAVSPSDIEPIYPQTPPCSTGSAVTFLDGVASGANSPSLTLYDAQVVTLTATDNPSGVSGTTDLTIVPGPISTFDVANPGTRTVGQLFSDTITAIDGYGNTATSYVGTQVLDFSGPSDSPSGAMPSYPSSVFFTNGMGTAENITLVDAQTTALMASQSPITGTSTPFQVLPGPISTFDVANPGTRTVGQLFSDTITAIDGYGNTATSYVGTQVLDFSGPSDSPSGAMPSYPSSVFFTNGMGTAENITLVDAQTTALMASQSPITGTSTSFLVVAGEATYYTVVAPSTATSGVPFTVTITAYDADGNVAAGYDGTADLASSIGDVSPLSVVLSNGVDTFNATLDTVGNQTITASDSSNPGITGASGNIDVTSTQTTTYTVTYSANNATSGTVPVDGLSPYNPGSLVTVLGNSGDLAVAGDNFTDWNTQANGLGNSYAPTSTFTIDANTILYAIFSPITPPTTYTVTYSANNATSGTVPVDGLSPYNPGSLVTVLGNSGDLAVAGDNFTDWNTQANGLGNSYAPTSTFTIDANTILYAIFSPITPPTTYTVTYSANNATSGTVPVDGLSPYNPGSLVTVLGNSGDLAVAGDNFTDWNTQANGLGNSYAPTSTFTIDANTILYAIFSPITPPTTYTVTYSANNATSGTVPVDGLSPYNPGSLVTVLGNSGDLAVAGDNFTDWNTQANGLGNSYAPTSTFTIDANTILYAIFSPITPPTTYTVTYSANNATSGTVPVDGLSPYNPGSLVTVLGNSGDLAVAGDNFTDWNTQANGLGNSYAPTSTFTIDANTILYAIFSPITPPTTYTVTYSANNATSGTVPVDGLSPYNPGSLVTVLGNSGDLAVAGDNFTDWNTQANGLGNSYAPTSTFTIDANTILYAIFSPITPPTTYTVTYSANNATSGTVPVDGLSPYNPGSLVTVLGNSGDLAVAGDNFTDWNTQANGLGNSYAPTSTFTINANTILYAIFSPITPPTTYTVTYSANNATSGTVPVDGLSPYNPGSLVTVLGNSGDLAVAGDNFTDWNTQANGLGNSYAPTSTFTIDANTILYAIFTKSLMITTTSLANATAGEAHYAQTLQGTGGTTPYTWSISEGVLPKGLSLNPSTGLISGSVSLSATTETFTVTLTDAKGASTTKQFTITVCYSLLITTKTLAGATAGESDYSQTLQGIGGATPYTWSISAGELPKGLSLNAASGLISGPVSSSATTETFTITLTDANGASTTKQFTITVCNFLAITTKSLEGAIAGQTNYSQTLQGTGGSQPYTWSISAGILPKGLFLNPSSGLISGNVSTSAVSETFTVKLSDANGASTAKQFTITVSQKPVFTCGNSGHAHFGHFFDFQFTAWGGPQPWFTVSGKLPSWLHFDSSNGIISGTPGSGQPGSYSFTVTATNSWGSQSQTFSLNVGN